MEGQVRTVILALILSFLREEVRSPTEVSKIDSEHISVNLSIFP